MRAKLLFLLLPCAIVLHADDVSGRWSGTLTLNGSNGASQAQTIYLILKQDDAILSGSAGNDERSQSAIRNGRVIPDGIQFDLGAVSVRLRLNGYPFQQPTPTCCGSCLADLERPIKVS